MALLSGSIRSECLGGNTWIQVATPDGVRRDGAPLRVIYTLHGTTGHSADWVRFTRLPLYAVEYGVAFVMPEIGNAWARDVPLGNRYFTYLTDELPELVAGLFNVSLRREDTAIIGNSAGAYSALRCGIARGDRFGRCAGFSSGGLMIDGYLDMLRAQDPLERENPHLHGTFGPDLRYDEDDVLLRLAGRMSNAEQRPEIYMAMGSEDALRDINDRFVERLRPTYPEVQYETWPGGHDWYFWDQALKRFLDRYYAQPLAT